MVKQLADSIYKYSEYQFRTLLSHHLKNELRLWHLFKFTKYD